MLPPKVICAMPEPRIIDALLLLTSFCRTVVLACQPVMTENDTTTQ